jgi:hypothetical protein
MINRLFSKIHNYLKINIMALEINNIYGVTCIKGKVSSTHVQEVKGYFKALLTIQDNVIINLCEVKKGTKKLVSVLENLQAEISEEKSLKFFSYPEPAVKELYAQLNSEANYYQAAA